METKISQSTINDSQLRDGINNQNIFDKQYFFRTYSIKYPENMVSPVVRAGVHSCSPVAPQRRVELFVEFFDGIVMPWPVLWEFGRFLQSTT